MEIHESLTAIKKRIWLIFLTAMIAVGSAWAVSQYYMEVLYTSTATIMFSWPTVQDPEQNFLLNSTYVKAYSALAESDSVAEGVIARLNLSDTVEDIQDRINIKTDYETGITSLAAESPQPAQAREIILAFIESVKEQNDKLGLQIVIKIIDEPKVPTEPSSPNILLNMALSGVGGVMAGLLLAILFRPKRRPLSATGSEPQNACPSSPAPQAPAPFAAPSGDGGPSFEITALSTDSGDGPPPVPQPPAKAGSPANIPLEMAVGPSRNDTVRPPEKSGGVAASADREPVPVTEPDPKEEVNLPAGWPELSEASPLEADGPSAQAIEVMTPVIVPPEDALQPQKPSVAADEPGDGEEPVSAGESIKTDAVLPPDTGVPEPAAHWPIEDSNAPNEDTIAEKPPEIPSETAPVLPEELTVPETGEEPADDEPLLPDNSQAGENALWSDDPSDDDEEPPVADEDHPDDAADDMTDALDSLSDEFGDVSDEFADLSELDEDIPSADPWEDAPDPSAGNEAEEEKFTMSQFPWLSLLGCIPGIPGQGGPDEPVPLASGISAAGRSIVDIRIRLQRALDRLGSRTIMITSPLPEDGKTVLSVNLAVSMARLNKRVLLIDCNTAKPALYKICDPKTRKKLSFKLSRNFECSYIFNKVTLLGFDVISDFIPSWNRMNGPEIPRLVSFLRSLEKYYDLIILDCPPAGSGDGLPSLNGLGVGVVMVGDYRRLTAPVLMDCVHNLMQGGAGIIGLAINNISSDDVNHLYK